MPQPFDYRLNLPNPVQGLLGAIQLAQGATQLQSQQHANQQAEQLRAELASLSAQPTPQGVVQMMLKYPQLSEAYKPILAEIGDQQRQARVDQASQVYAALIAGRPEIAQNLLSEQVEAYHNSGMEDEAKKAEDISELVRLAPEAAATSAGLFLSAAMGPKKFAETFAKLQETRKVTGWSVLNSKQKKALGLDLDKPFQIGPDGKVQLIGGTGVSVNINGKSQFGTIPPGWQLVEDGGKYTMAPIPGGPEEAKAVAFQRSEAHKQALVGRAGGVVFEDLDRLKMKIENSPWYSPVLGLPGAIVSAIGIPGTNRIDAEQLTQTIVANIGFDRLQQMREAAPTGGALGNVSDRELSTLQAIMGNLALSQSKKQLLYNIDRVNAIYAQILEKARAYPNAEQFGFGSARLGPSQEVKPTSVAPNVDDLLQKYLPAQ